MNLYISDLHFGHASVINFDNRPFADKTEMDNVMIRLWNERVFTDDNVYIIGDFCFRNENPAEWYLRQLKGHKHLVVGNHDLRTLENEKAMSYFESVDKMMHVQDEDKQICLCHFPVAEWNGYHKGHWHIYGHIHGRKDDAYEFMRTKERALNAAACINHYTPVSINELIRNNQRHRGITVKSRMIEKELEEALAIFSETRLGSNEIKRLAMKYALQFDTNDEILAHKGINWYAKEILKVNKIVPFDYSWNSMAFISNKDD